MNLLDRIVIKRRRLFVDDVDLIEVVDLINRTCDDRDIRMSVGNCRWDDYPRKWFVEFSITDYRWTSAIEQLNHKFRILIVDRPDDMYLERRS